LKVLVWMLLLIHMYFAIRGTITFVTGGLMDGTAGGTSGQVGSGPLSDENDFALAINMMIPFGLFGIQYLKGRARIVCVVLLLLFALAVVSSFSRGGIVGLAAIVLFALVVSKRKVLTIGVIVLLALVMAFFAPQSYWKEAGTITDTKESTANSRLEYWSAGMRMFAAHPVIGVGADNGGVQMPQFYRGKGNPNTRWGRAFHGTWPQVLAELGLLGGVPYFAMMILAFRHLYLIRRRSLEETDRMALFLSNSLLGSLVAYIGCATFLSTAYYPQLWTTYTLVMILVFCQQRVGKTSQLTQVNESAGIAGATS
jgi:putative inorganic carbon (HCO3(-)) transporter